MPAKLKLIALGHLSSALCLPVFAQGTAFTHQRFLTENRALANSKDDFGFQLFDAAPLGSPVGSAVKIADLPMANGLFTVLLDFGDATFTGDDRWLEIPVRPEAPQPNHRTPANC